MHLPDLTARLRAAGCVFAEEEAALLIVEADSADDLARMVAQRVAGIPLEVVVGHAEFAGLRVTVEAGVFVPRRRTELLVRRAADLVLPATEGTSVVVDLCCGSGAVGAALAATSPRLEVYAADLDPSAVACARRNLPPDRVFAGDLYAALPAALRGRVDLLVCNAPYVPTDAIALMPPEARLHEAGMALDGGADGTEIQARVIEDAPAWLADGGWLLIETSAEQAALTRRLMVEHGLSDVAIDSDEELAATVVRGRHRSSAATAPASGRESA